MFWHDAGAKRICLYSIVYCLFGVWFIVYLPVSLYTKSKRQVEKSEVFKNPVTYILNDEGIEIVQEKKRHSAAGRIY